MNYTPILVWSLLLAGVLLVVVLGRRASGWGMSLAIAAGVGLPLIFVTSIALAACVQAKFCSALGDEGIVYALYPLFAAPVFWLVARLSGRRDQ